MKRALTILIIVFFGSQSLFALTALEIMKKTEKLAEPRTVKSTVEMTIYKGGDSVKRKIKQKSIKVGENEKVLVDIVSPFQMKVLTHTNRNGDDQQWLKLKNGKIKKIISGDRKKAFVNSHIFFEDMRSRVIEDYNYQLLGSEKVENFDCYKIEANPKPGKSIYDKAIFFVIKSGDFAFFVVRGDIFYKGYLYKRLINYNIKKTNGIITPYKFVMYRLNKKGEKLGRTVLQIQNMKYNSTTINVNMFNKSRL